MAKTTWVLDPTHSELGFKIRHLMITNVSGSFTNFEAKATMEDGDLSTASVTLKAAMDSINTNNHQRDAHLRNADFFETEKYPNLEFQSTRFEKLNNEEYKVYGNLTMKGVTAPIALNLEYSGVTKDPWGNERAGFIVTGIVKRSQWNIQFNATMETGGVVLGEDVKLHAEIQMVKEVVAEPVPVS